MRNVQDKEVSVDKKGKILMCVFTSFVFFIIGMSFISLSYAGVKIDPINGSFSVSEGFTYNSNVAYADKGYEDSACGNILTANAALELPFGEMHKYALQSQTSWEKYFSHNDDYSHVNTNLAHSLDFVFNKWMLNVHHSFVLSGDPDSVEAVVVGRKVFKKKVNYPGFAIKGDLGKMKVGTGFDYQDYKTNEDYEGLERESYATYVESGFAVTSLIDTFMRYTYTRTNKKSETASDSDGNDLRLGLRGQLTPYVVGEFGIGYSWINFEHKSTSADESDYNGIVYSAALTNRFSELTTNKLSFSYTPEQGYDSGNYFKTYLVGYNISHKLNSKINLEGLAEYVHSQESGEGRYRQKNANVWKWGAGLDYAFGKNINFGIDYNFITKDSSKIHGGDYDQHSTTVKVTYNF